jgi:hypothetical protein
MALVVMFRKITTGALQTLMKNINFPKTGFTAQMGFIVVQYSATNNCVPSNNQFHFHANTFKLNCI